MVRTPTDQVEVIVSADAELGEGPMWDVRTGRLVWIDILGRRVHQSEPQTGATESLAVPLDIGTIAPRAAGGFIAALQDGFWVVGDGPAHRIATVPQAAPDIRFNDGKCDPQGRFWAGTMPYDETRPVGSLYRLDTNGSVTRMLSGVTISNGLAWSADGRTMFHIDTPTRRIDAFDFDPELGAMSNRRPAVEIPASAGWPDGMTLDGEGGLWVALWGGGAVHRYVDGRLDRVIRLPVTQPTSCAFGGTGMDELFVTSARKGLSAGESAAQPLAGSVFRVRPGVAGILPFTWAGA
jgi:sugar lactone lactonase YvrE